MEEVDSEDSLGGPDRQGKAVEAGRKRGGDRRQTTRFGRLTPERWALLLRVQGCEIRGILLAGILFRDPTMAAPQRFWEGGHGSMGTGNV